MRKVSFLLFVLLSETSQAESGTLQKVASEREKGTERHRQREREREKERRTMFVGKARSLP